MECFLRDIAFNAREPDVHLVISNALHGGDFSQFGDQPINFYLQLHKNRRGGGQAHGGTGSLVLPRLEIGQAFVQRYGLGGVGQLMVNQRRIHVLTSTKRLRQDIVERLRLTTYRNPQSDAEKRWAARAEELETVILVTKIEQGWLSRDSTFFSESTIKPSAEIKGLSLHFEDTNRQVMLKITTPDHSLLSMVDQHYQIRFRYSDVRSIVIDHSFDDHTVHFRLRNSVSYELSKGSFLAEFANLGFDTGRPPQRSRLCSLEFDPDHKDLAEYISRDILVHMDRLSAAKFTKLAKVARLSFREHGIVLVEPSNAISNSSLHELRQWINRQPWEVAFQLEKILRNMLLSPQEFGSMRGAMSRIIQDPKMKLDSVVAVLLDFIARLEILDRNEDLEGSEERTPIECLNDALAKANRTTLVSSRLRRARKKGTHGDFLCLHAVVTPTRVALEGPSPEQLNRVLRMYPGHWKHFLRVRFTDEEQLPFRWQVFNLCSGNLSNLSNRDPEVNAPEFVKKRVGGILRDGIEIAGRNFEYLGYSSSALKTHTVWFVRPFTDPVKGLQNAKTIIKALGDFSRDIRFPARMGARIAQAFSSTDLSISVEELINIPDIERNGSCFTDGVGTISPEVAKMIWRSLRKLRKRASYFVPAAYQVRLGGHKGMLAIDYRLEGSVVCVRKSMDKFDSPSLDIEIARAFDRPGPCFLNRPLIMILETANNIHTDIFLFLQRRAVRDTRESMRTFHGAARLLEAHGLGASFKITSVMNRLQHLGLDLEHCEGLGMKMVLKDAETDILRELKHRARIPVPDSWKLVGIADEFDYLGEKEIYACVRDRSEDPIYLKGPYLITRSPAIHPGDVQVVTAIGKPPPGTPFDIEPLANTVVLSCRGGRSLASFLGGGDLDGDLYDLINLTAWPDLTPQSVSEPAEYPPAPKKEIKGRDCNLDDVKDFICDFITSDLVGMISVRHLKFADYRPSGVKDPDCIALAALHSRAVDFPKSGSPVLPSELPRFEGHTPRPDWDAGELGFRSDREDVYVSQRALGHLYRDIKLSEDDLQHKGTHPSSRFGTDLDLATHARPLSRRRFDAVSNHLRRALYRYIEVDNVPQQYFDEAVELLEEYIGELSRICNTYALTARSVLSEEEVVAGTILERTSQHRRRRDMISEMRTASSALVGNVHDILRGSDSDEIEDWLLRSWAAYQVSRSSDEFGRKSFGLLTLGNAFEGIEAITQRNLVR